MRGKLFWHRLLLMAIAGLITAAALYGFSVRSIEAQLRTQLREHLSVAMPEGFFSDSRGRVNDRVSLAYIGSQINQASSAWVSHSWFAAMEPAEITILDIDGIYIGSSTNATLTLPLPRNGQVRIVSVAYRLNVHWPIFALLALGTAALLGVMLRLLPRPLTKSQALWHRQLAASGYDPDTAYAAVSVHSEEELALTPLRRRIFDLVHRPQERNFTLAMQAANDPRVAAFSELDVEWFGAGLATDIDTAWAYATRAEAIVVDLVAAKLSVRGCNVSVTKTPLFYYAWYALKRTQGDGWMLNPPSNRPDVMQGRELAKLMWQHKGHAKAIDELEEHGLRAKTLDQNRSKIKEELLAALGPPLAEQYLFDTEKDVQGRLRHRLKPQPSQLQVITAQTTPTDRAPQSEFKQHSA
jgi:hypothetical protein